MTPMEGALPSCYYTGKVLKEKKKKILWILEPLSSLLLVVLEVHVL